MLKEKKNSKNVFNCFKLATISFLLTSCAHTRHFNLNFLKAPEFTVHFDVKQVYKKKVQKFKLKLSVNKKNDLRVQVNKVLYPLLYMESRGSKLLAIFPSRKLYYKGQRERLRTSSYPYLYYKGDVFRNMLAQKKIRDWTCYKGKKTAIKSCRDSGLKLEIFYYKKKQFVIKFQKRTLYLKVLKVSKKAFRKKIRIPKSYKQISRLL